MAGFDDNEARAAEYVLGTLTPEELREAERDLAADPAFALLVAEWERRLSPLALALQPVAAPGHLKAKILNSISGPFAEGSNVILLQRRVTHWRIATAAVTALAAGLVGFMMLKPAPEPSAGRFVAVLQAEGPGPAFVGFIALFGGAPGPPQGGGHEPGALNPASVRSRPAY